MPSASRRYVPAEIVPEISDYGAVEGADREHEHARSPRSRLRALARGAPKLTAPARLTQADVRRFMKGARDAGFSRVRVGIDPEGNIVVDASDEPGEFVPIRRNPLDRLLEQR